MIAQLIALIISGLCFLVGMILSIFGIGGSFVIFAGAVLYNLITWSWAVTQWTLGILLFLAVFGEVLEWVLSVYGAKKFKMTNWTTAGFIIGTIVGMIAGSPIFIVGTIAGAFIGAFLGAFIFSLIEKKDFDKALKAGTGAFVTRIGVSIMKFVFAIIMIVLFYISLLA